MIILQTNNLSKKYGDHIVVDDVTMTIEEGDVYGFVGENGAGKTTLIRLITGIISPLSGTFSIFGKKLYELEKLGTVAAVVETPSIFPYMTAVDNIKEQMLVLGVKEDETFIDNLLDKVGLLYLKDSKKRAVNFSLGMKQRLTIAMALAGDPKFLILDEPMNGLDPEGIVGIRNLILELSQKDKITFLISSHMLGELSKVATKYGFISHGKLIQEITAKELHQKAQKRLELKLSEDANINPIMKKLGVKKFSFENGKLTIYDSLSDYSNLISDLVAAKINVYGVENIEGNIEEYYLSLIGGKNE